MKTGVLIIWLLFLVNTTETEKINTQSQIELDGEIHNQNLIDSVEGFLQELGLDVDSCYVPFRDVNIHVSPIHQADVENSYQQSFLRSQQQ